MTLSQPLFKGIKFTSIDIFSFNIDRSPSILKSQRVPEAKLLKKDQSFPKPPLFAAHLSCGRDHKNKRAVRAKGEFSNTEKRLAENWLGLHEAGSIAKLRRNWVSTAYVPQYYYLRPHLSTLEIQMYIRKYVQIHFIQYCM